MRIIKTKINRNFSSLRFAFVFLKQDARAFQLLGKNDLAILPDFA